MNMITYISLPYMITIDKIEPSLLKYEQICHILHICVEYVVLCVVCVHVIYSTHAIRMGLGGFLFLMNPESFLPHPRTQSHNG